MKKEDIKLPFPTPEVGCGVCDGKGKIYPNDDFDGGSTTCYACEGWGRIVPAHVDEIIAQDEDMLRQAVIGLLEDCMDRDHFAMFFSATKHSAKKFNVSINELADVLGLNAATLYRWAKGTTEPQSFARPIAMGAILEKLREKMKALRRPDIEYFDFKHKQKKPGK